MSQRREIEDAYEVGGEDAVAALMGEPKLIDTERVPVTVDGVAYEVEVETWRFASPTFHIHRGDDCLTEDDALEEFPSHEKILEAAKFWDEGTP